MQTIHLDRPHDPPDALHLIKGGLSGSSTDAVMYVDETVAGLYTLCTWSPDPVRGSFSSVGKYTYPRTGATLIHLCESEWVFHKGCYFIVREGALHALPLEEGERLDYAIPSAYCRHELDKQIVYLPPGVILTRIEEDMFHLNNAAGQHGECIVLQEYAIRKLLTSGEQFYILAWQPLLHMHTHTDAEAAAAFPDAPRYQGPSPYTLDQSYEAVNDDFEYEEDMVHLYGVASEDVVWGQKAMYRVTGESVTKLTDTQSEVAIAAENIEDARRQRDWLTEQTAARYVSLSSIISELLTGDNVEQPYGTVIDGQLVTYPLCDGTTCHFLDVEVSGESIFIVNTQYHGWMLYPEATPVHREECLCFYQLVTGTLILMPNEPPLVV